MRKGWMNGMLIGSQEEVRVIINQEAVKAIGPSIPEELLQQAQ